MSTPASLSSTTPLATDGPSVARLRTLLRGPAPVAMLLIGFLALGLSAAQRESLTWDEGTYLVAGYSYWATGDYRLCSENGNAVMRWETLPLWLGGYKFPSLEDPDWKSARALRLADKFLYDSGNDAERMILRSRQTVAMLSAALGLLVYLWSRKLFGPYGGLISLTLYVTSPVVLSNGFLATSDMAVTLWFTAATWSLWNLLQRITPWTLAASCGSLAILFLTKFSAVIIIPVGLLLLAARLARGEPLPVSLGRAKTIRGRASQALVFAGICVAQILFVAATIWAAFGFRYTMLAPPENREVNFVAGPANGGGLTLSVIGFARDHHLLPEAYLYGFHYIASRANVCHNFLNGQFSSHGFLGFFPYCAMVKTPLATFLALGLAAWACQRRLQRKQPAGSSDGPLVQLYEITPLAALIGVYWAFALNSDMNVGVRYLLPTYPAIFILAGAAAWWFRPRDPDSPPTIAAPAARWARGLLIAALAINLAEAAWSWPNYLAYFNPLAGGPDQGYRHLVDSSLDWGQDLPALARWLKNDPQASADPQRDYLSYCGTARPEAYGIQAQPLLSHGPVSWGPTSVTPPQGGVYCVSATMLQSVYNMFPGRWNKEYETTYQEVRARLAQLAQTPDAAVLTRHKPVSPFGDSPGQVFDVFHHLQLARLCAFLRAREPDANVGHSILIYRLTDDDVRQALSGTAAEMAPAPGAQN